VTRENDQKKPARERGRGRETPPGSQKGQPVTDVVENRLQKKAKKRKKLRPLRSKKEFLWGREEKSEDGKKGETRVTWSDLVDRKKKGQRKAGGGEEVPLRHESPGK